MKKFLMIFAALTIGIMATAQTVQSSKLFENTYVSVFGGATTSTAFGQTATPFFWDGAKEVFDGIRPLAGIEFGKYITPVVGFGIEGIAFFNTTGSYTFVDQSNVLLNGKINFSNWFGGYKGYPRRVEIVGVAGLGWGHDYGEPRIDPNYVVYNTGAEINVNLGKQRAWQITVRPGVLWNNYDNLPAFNWGTDARVNIQAGVVYKFGSKSKKSHNFVLCPYSVTQGEYDALLAKYNDLASREPQVVEKEVVKVEEKVVKDTVEVDIPGSCTVFFEIGSAKISEREKAHLDFYARGLNDKKVTVKVTGSADTKTGSAKRNQTLAQQRADAVKNVLVNEFGFKAEDVATEVVLDVFNDPVRSRVAIIE